MEPAGSSVTINFSNKLEISESPISLALDEEYNVTESGSRKTKFGPSDTAFFLVFSELSYTLYKSVGTLKKVATNVPSKITERVFFYMTKTASLRYTANNASFTWIGDNPGATVAINGKEVILSKEAVGVLEVTYDSYGDRWKIAYSLNVEDLKDVDVVIVGINEAGSKSYLNLGADFEEEEDEEGLESQSSEYQLRVIDMCSKDPVEGVEVRLDGKLIGTTESDGTIYLGEIQKNVYHTLHMSKEGYLSSDLDAIKNDGFTIF